nr:MAG TPA: hypothetical protein [Caudoviricetes sp.]
MLTRVFPNHVTTSIFLFIEIAVKTASLFFTKEKSSHKELFSRGLTYMSEL